MIAKPFDKPQPPPHADPMHKAGWSAEQDAAFRLDRAFGDPARRDVRLFHDIRLPATFSSGAVAEGDYFQIDHLVLHRHGVALVESKSVVGDLNVDRLGQWQRRYTSRTINIESPVTQVKQQASALLRLLQSAAPTLLNKFMGVLQGGFGGFPMAPFVAISDTGRFTGATAPYVTTVMKVDRIVEAVTAEINKHERKAGFLGFLRGAIEKDMTDAGLFNLALEELDRMEKFLLARHTPLIHTPQPRATPSPPAPAPTTPPAIVAPAVRPAVPKDVPPAAPKTSPTPASPADQWAERLEALACGKCRSINVRITYARDYCLKCDECGKFTALPYLCPHCGKHATIRKNADIHFRECDGQGGCGVKTVFCRAPRATPKQ